MNTLQDFNSLNSRPESLDAFLDPGLESKDSQSISQDMQVLVTLIANTSSISNLDTQITQGKIPIDQYTSPVITNQILKNLFSFANFQEYTQLQSKDLNNLILDFLSSKFDEFSHAQIMQALHQVPAEVFTLNDNFLVHNLIAKIQELFLFEENVSNIFDYLNVLNPEIFIDLLPPKFNQFLIDNKLNPSNQDLDLKSFITIITDQPKILNNAPDSLLNLIFKSFKPFELPALLIPFLQEVPGNFDRVLDLLKGHNLSPQDFKICFQAYFDQDIHSRTFKFLTLITQSPELNRYLPQILPDFSFTQKLKFKTFGKRQLLKQFQPSDVAQFEEIFIKKSTPTQHRFNPRLVEIYQYFYTDFIIDSELDSLYLQAQNSLADTNITINSIQQNLNFEIQSLESLEKLNQFLKAYQYSFEFVNNEFIFDLNGNKINISVSDTLLNQAFTPDSLKLQDYATLLDSFDYQTLSQKQSITDLNPLSLKLLKLSKINPQAFEAFSTYQNKAFLLSSGIGLNILTTNGSNIKELNQQVYFTGQFIGSGTFGNVTYGLTNINNRYEILAVKEIREAQNFYGFYNEIQGSQNSQTLNIPELISIKATGQPADITNVNKPQDLAQYFLTMETGQDSRDLLQLIGDRNISPETLIGYLEKVLSGLESLWDQGFCHLDFKPQNTIIFRDQFSDEIKLKIIDLNLPKIDELFTSKWFRTPDYSFSKHFVLYQFVLDQGFIQPNDPNFNLIDLIKDHNDPKKYNLDQLTHELQLLLLNNKTQIETDQLSTFLKEVAIANDLKAFFKTLQLIVNHRNLGIKNELLDILEIYGYAIQEVEALKRQVARRQTVDPNQILSALSLELNLFKDPDNLSRIKQVLAELKKDLKAQTQVLQAQAQTQVLQAQAQTQVLQAQAQNQPAVSQAPISQPEPQTELQMESQPESQAPISQPEAQPSVLELPQAELQMEPTLELPSQEITSQLSPTAEDTLQATQANLPESTLSIHEMTIQGTLFAFFDKTDPTEEDFQNLFVGMNQIFTDRNGQKESMKRKLKNFVFGKVSLKTKLKAAALAIPTGAILSSKALLAATGLGTLIGTSPVMPIVLMTIFFKTCSASAMSTIFTKRRLKKLLNDDTLDSRVLKLFYYASQAVGNEADIQKDLNLTLEELKQGRTLSMQDIQISLQALSQTQNQDKIKDFVYGLGLSTALSSAFYYALNLEPVSDFINEKMQTLKGFFSGFFNQTPDVPSSSASSVSLDNPTPSQPNSNASLNAANSNLASAPNLAEPAASVQSNSVINPEVQAPELPQALPTQIQAPNTSGYIAPTGHTSDAIRIDSGGSKVHMRGPDGEKLTNAFGFNRFWNNQNPWVRVDLNNPKVVNIDGKSQVIYQTLLKGKPSGRWIAGIVLSK